jgi:diguanylate cyclase (GGDEF)-like protein
MIDQNMRILPDTFFNYFLGIELERAKRYQNYLSLISVRFDLNPDPDPAMSEIAGQYQEMLPKILCDELREVDVIGKLDDQTYSVILLHADEDATFKVSERLRDRIHTLYSDSNVVTTSVSIGGACCPKDGCEPFELKKHALRMLEKAIENGGNQTIMVTQ